MIKVTLVMALTMDGKIGTGSNHYTDWTEPADKKLFLDISRKAGVLIMGARTFDTIGRPLPGRRHIIFTRNEKRPSKWDNVIFSSDTPSQIVKKLSEEGFTEAILAGGARINYLFAAQRLIDEIVVTYSPKVFGVGLSLFSDPIPLDLQLLDTRKIGSNTILARYRVLYPD